MQHAKHSAEQMGIPMKLLAPNDARLRRRYQANFALIRPDQHVVWRGDEIPEDFSSVLPTVTGQHAAVAADANAELPVAAGAAR